MKILALAGSLRKDSFNKKLIRLAAKAAEQSGAKVTLVDLKDYPLAPYDGDDEKNSGVPENGQKLKKLFMEYDGFMFASPEYNSSISGTFKNVIDWVSRPEKSDPSPMPAFRGKWAAIMSASPGALGGLRGLVHLRQILNNINVHVIPEQVTISKAQDAFDDAGNLGEKEQKKVEDLAGAFVSFLEKMTR